jgi:hypothetical protein
MLEFWCSSGIIVFPAPENTGAVAAEGIMHRHMGGGLVSKATAPSAALVSLLHHLPQLLR